MFGTYTQYKTKIAPALGTLFCYVEYDQEENVLKALQGFQDLLVKDQKLNVRRLNNQQASLIFTNILSTNSNPNDGISTDAGSDSH
jgi:hypothetical protein